MSRIDFWIVAGLLGISAGLMWHEVPESNREALSMIVGGLLALLRGVHDKPTA
jgi:hypothetical protein